MKNLGKLIFTGLFIINFAVLLQAQNQSASYFIYDDNGRLQAVIYPTGDAVIYEYDAAGNFTSIRRVNSNSLEFISFNPRSGLQGTRVTLYGVGFSGVNSVLFNGLSAKIITATNNIIIAEVPPSATSGLITVNTPLGSAVSAIPFIIQGIIVAPSNITLREGQTQQFTAQVTIPGDNGDIRWSVNEVIGGSNTIGTITSSGLYTAPTDLETSITIVVKATSIRFPLILGEAQVRVQSVNDLQFTHSGSISIGKGFEINQINQFSPSISVSKGEESDRAAYSFPISISKNQELIRDSRSLNISVARNPTITSIVPFKFRRNSTTAITITGSNLNAVKSFLPFIGSSIDTEIKMFDVVVNAQGNSLTANLTVGNSPSGTRTILIKTLSNRLINVRLDNNSIHIVP